MDLIKIGNFIVFLRKEKKLTQLQLAEELDVSDKSVSKWERGVCLPGSSTVEKLINFFGITLMEFYAGERNEKLADKVVNETTKKALEISLDDKKKRYKKVIYSIISCFIIIVFTISTLFMYNTYNKYHVYNITSSTEEFSGKGNIILAGDKSIITLMELNLANEKVYNKTGYSFEYSIVLGEILLYKSGDIYSFENDTSNNKLSVGEYIEKINLYLNYDLSDITKKDALDKVKLILKIKYINDKLEIDEYKMSFNISKSFSTNKIITSNKVY